MSTDTPNTEQPQDIKPAETVVTPAEELVVTPVQATPPAEEKPLADELGLKKEVKTPSKKPETVPFHVFEALKKEKKLLEEQLEKGETLDDADLEDLTKKYDVSPAFISDFMKVAEKKMEAKYGNKIEQIDAKDREAQINQAFTTSFDKAMANLPEYKGLVNPSVIKTLSLDPSNHDKTMTQLIKSTYQMALPGKKPLETSTPGAGRIEGEELDFAKAKSDSVYFAEVMKDPKLKEQYNKHLLQNTRL